ncbi:hypothetical protein Taro_000642 [Colocasia esculenta]|uniref:Protein kinase domain-containing protein n=1 Tax=Colocasia esculenta TaxID=4460 RepID=A0A843TH25_COLES|nr:hypothetical protein [Colocasia esculenta]
MATHLDLLHPPPPHPLLHLLCSAPITHLFYLLLLSSAVSASNSHSEHLEESTGGTWNGLVPPRRYLVVSRKSTYRRSATPLLPSSSFSSSYSVSSLSLERQNQLNNSQESKSRLKNTQRKEVLWFVLELFAGAVSGVAFGAVVTVCFALKALNRDDEESPRLVFGYTVLDPDIMWAPELSSLCGEEQELPHMEVIGRGACGVVYRADIPNSGGAVVAVKQVDRQPSVSTAQLCGRDEHLLGKVARQIRSEIMTAGFVRHPNILPLLAHVYRNDRHLPRLRDALMRGRGPAAGGSRELDWPARFKIARGIAAGLEFLHVVHRPAVVHRDLKPANILLADTMEARISDFGLAKEASHLDDGLTTSNIAGTIGYIAPEYYQVMRYTDRCDVYSFGMILAVLVTGRFPTDRFFQTSTEEMCLAGWVRNGMRSEDPAAAAVDKKLLGNGFEAQMVLTLKIACFCTYDNPGHRPNMRDVRCMLSQIKH